MNSVGIEEKLCKEHPRTLFLSKMKLPEQGFEQSVKKPKNPFRAIHKHHKVLKKPDFEKKSLEQKKKKKGSKIPGVKFDQENIHNRGCFYILENHTYEGPILKVGMSSSGFDNRLRSYRTGNPLIKVVFVMFVDKPQKIEKEVLEKFSESLMFSSHEVFKKTPDLIGRITSYATSCANFFELKNNIVPYNIIEKYNNAQKNSLKRKEARVL